MQFFTPVFGLLVLSAFVYCMPAGDDAQSTEVPANASSTSAEIKDEPSSTVIVPSRAQDPSTSVPPLQHSGEAKPEGEKPVAPPVATEQKATENKAAAPGGDNGKGAAASHTQVFSFVLSSLVVLLISAI